MEEQQPGLASTFPKPPFFWQLFTPENTERIRELRAGNEASKTEQFDPAKELPTRVLELPTELRFLQPPEVPTDGSYRVFGDEYTLEDRLPPLSQWGIQSLHTPPPSESSNSHDLQDSHDSHAFTLKKMAKSLLLNFLELVGIMAYTPIDFAEKVEDIQTIFLNFHHLVNTYRPHQARESLILMMQAQLEKSRSETRGIREMKAKVEGILEGLGKIGLGEEEQIAPTTEKAEFVEEDREVWDELERSFG